MERVVKEIDKYRICYSSRTEIYWVTDEKGATIGEWDFYKEAVDAAKAAVNRRTKAFSR